MADRVEHAAGALGQDFERFRQVSGSGLRDDADARGNSQRPERDRTGQRPRRAPAQRAFCPAAAIISGDGIRPSASAARGSPPGSAAATAQADEGDRTGRFRGGWIASSRSESTPHPPVATGGAPGNDALFERADQKHHAR